MKYAKFNRYEKKEIRANFIKNAMAGTGLYLYENSSRHAELTLPRSTASGVRKVGPSGQFQGDDYYMQLVRTGDLKCIKVLQQITPEEIEVPILEEKSMNEQTLILDQPARVTNKGVVEQVVEKTKKQNLREGNNGQPQVDILLNENPSEDGFIIVTN